MSGGENLPPRLRAALAADPPGAKPLLHPGRRLLWLVPLAALLLTLVPAVLGLRHDLADLGPLLSLGGSLLQIAGGLALLLAALVEAVPGRQLSRRRLIALGLVALLAFLALTLATDQATGTRVPAGKELRYFEVCLGTPLLLALPLLAVALLLLFRAFPVRPALAGLLAGLGSGLSVDAAWRLFCEVSDPRHVIAVHGGAILLAAALGMLLAVVVSRLSRRR